MITYIINDKAKFYEDNGILEKHFEGFAKTAKEKKAIIIVRGVNPITKNLLSQGYPTKGFDIKNKSSDWGIQAGFIISRDELTFLNKNGLNKNENVNDRIATLCEKFLIKLDVNNPKNNKINTDIIGLEKNEIILTITIGHLEYLIKNKRKYGITEIEYCSNKNIFIRCHQIKNNQNNAIFFLEKFYNNYKIYFTFALCNKNKVKNLNDKTLKAVINSEKNNLIYFPFIVFSATVGKEKKPLIPDYDLFSIIWKLDYAIKYNAPIIPVNSFNLTRQNILMPSNKEKNFNTIFKKTHSLKGTCNYQENRNLGNVSVAIIEIIDVLNKNLGYPKGISDELRPIHHGHEMYNPFSRKFCDNLYTIFLPNPAIIKDFNFSNKKDNDISDTEISYFIIQHSLNNSDDLWSNGMLPLLKHFQKKGYYVPKNCFVKQTKSLGLVNASNIWLKNIN